MESFLAEGMGYDLGAGLLGLVVGVGVVFAMVFVLESTVGDELGLILSVNVTPRSLAIAFCIGVIATFIVIVFASIRASRINIVAAIRDLPETRPINAENATKALDRALSSVLLQIVRWVGTGQAPAGEASIIEPPSSTAEPSSSAATAPDESGTASSQSAQL